MPRIATNYTPPAPAEIRELRARLGLTQTEVAETLGVSPRTVQKWELGETAISKMGWIALQSLSDAN